MAPLCLVHYVCCVMCPSNVVCNCAYPTVIPYFVLPGEADVTWDSCLQQSQGIYKLSAYVKVCDNYFDLDNIHSSKTMPNDAKICQTVTIHCTSLTRSHCT